MTTLIKGSNLDPAISIVTTSDIITEGKLGVGVDTPLGNIHSKSAINSLLVLESEDTNSDIIFMDTVGSTRIRSAGDQLQFWTGGDASTIATNASVALTLTDDVTVANNLVIGGNLTVNGTTTTLNTATLDVEDINITIAKGALDSATADGAGITVDGAGATLLYNSAPDAWSFNKNVGIGASGADYRLVVEGENNLGAVYIHGGTGASWGLEIGSHTQGTESDLVLTDNAVIGSQDSLSFVAEDTGYFRWMTGGNSHKTGTAGATERMRITSGGNVGIRTVDPESQLHIYQPSGELGLYVTRTPTIAGGASVGLTVDSTGSRIYGYGDRLSFWTAATGGTAENRLHITSSGNVEIYGSNTLGVSEKFLWDATNNALKLHNLSEAGELAINPIYNDQQNGYWRSSLVFTRNRDQITWDTATGLWTHAGGSSTDWSAIAHKNASFDIYRGTSSTNGWSVSNDDFVSDYLALTIDDNRNVGIGTSSPAKKLSVKSDGGGSQLGIDIHNEGTAAGDDAVISFETQASREWTMGLDRSSLSFVIAEGSTLSSTQRFVIDDSGKVGIGTEQPAGIFHANDTASFPITLSRDDGTDANTAIRYKQATTSWYTGANYNNLFAFKYNDPDLGASPLMTIDTTGNLEIAGDLNTLSDRTLKDNIEPIQNASDIIDQLNGYSFDWKEREGKKGHGVIAQELEEVLPTLVSEREDGIKTVNYLELIPFLIEAVKTQNNRIKALEALLNK